MSLLEEVLVDSRRIRQTRSHGYTLRCSVALNSTVSVIPLYHHPRFAQSGRLLAERLHTCSVPRMRIMLPSSGGTAQLLMLDMAISWEEIGQQQSLRSEAL